MQVLSDHLYIVLWELELREQTFKNANTLATAISRNNKLLLTLSFMSSTSTHETGAGYVVSFQVGKNLKLSTILDINFIPEHPDSTCFLKFTSNSSPS